MGSTTVSQALAEGAALTWPSKAGKLPPIAGVAFMLGARLEKGPPCWWVACILPVGTEPLQAARGHWPPWWPDGAVANLPLLERAALGRAEMTGQKENQVKGQGPFCGDDKMGCGAQRDMPGSWAWGGLAGVDRRP